MTTHFQQRIGNAKYFTWGEATRQGTVLPDSQQIIENIELTALNMDTIRSELGGKPLYVSSWYRTPSHNTRIGGAKNSLHLQGLAVDFYSKHLSPIEIYNRLNVFHGNKGGLGLYAKHIHIDWRGYNARW